MFQHKSMAFISALSLYLISAGRFGSLFEDNLRFAWEIELLRMFKASADVKTLPFLILEVIKIQYSILSPAVLTW